MGRSIYATFGQKSAYVRDFWPKTRVDREGSGKKQAKGQTKKRGVSMDEHVIKCNPETKRNREQVNNIKPIVVPKGQLLGTPQRSRQFYYGDKFLWLGVPQQTARLQKSIFPNMQ